MYVHIFVQCTYAHRLNNHVMSKNLCTYLACIVQLRPKLYAVYCSTLGITKHIAIARCCKM